MDKFYSAQRYNNVAILLHWLIAAAVLFMIGLGWYMSDIPKGDPTRSYWFNLHKSIGVTIGVLVLIRLLWRATHQPPALPASMPAWEQTAARINHTLLYVCLLAMPLVGFLASNYTKYGVKYFGIQIGPFFAENQARRDALQEVHELLSYVLVALVVIHVVAALKHLFIDRDNVFQRMLPGGSRAG
ncbi:MAG TPA: cytochrome b [Burkholderiales bacterium]|nr:cytochrome b [Burkholderiales bacterium]